MRLFGRRSDAPSPPRNPNADPLSTPLPSEVAVLTHPTTRFRVSDIYMITGIGCVAVGVLEQGTIRPPVVLRIVHSSTALSDGTAHRVRVVQAEAHHAAQAEVFPGMTVGLALRAGDGPAVPPKVLRGWLAKGDLLVAE